MPPTLLPQCSPLRHSAENVEQLTLDVSDLPVPEPFDVIMKTLKVMRKDQYLRVTHRKQPLLLYKPLQQLGFNFHVQKGDTQVFEIFIWAENQDTPPGIILPNLASRNDTPTNCSDC